MSESTEKPHSHDIHLIGSKPLRYWISCSLERYFAELDGAAVSLLYELVQKEMDHALLSTVMRHAQGNQCLAANWLGIARGTLRKKLKEAPHVTHSY